MTRRPARRARRPRLPVLLVAALLALAAVAVGAERAGLLSGRGDPADGVPVVRVVDGDTIHVRIDGREAAVRYIGVDTPEVDPRVGVERFGWEASGRNRALVEGKRVRLEKDVSEADRFGRLLRYVYLPDGRMVNAVLIEEGYARAVTFPPDVRHGDLFRRLEREAREGKRGMWGE